LTKLHGRFWQIFTSDLADLKKIMWQRWLPGNEVVVQSASASVVPWVGLPPFNLACLVGRRVVAFSGQIAMQAKRDDRTMLAKRHRQKSSTDGPAGRADNNAVSVWVCANRKRDLL
jgi:hypothetical protein